MLLIFAFSLLSLFVRARAGVYEEVYPSVANFSINSVHDCDPDASPDGTCPLFFGLLSSFGGIYRSSGCIPGVKIALDEINSDSSILPGYLLHYTLRDSNCNRQIAQSSFFSFMLHPPVKVGILGGGCSVATEPTAELAHYYNLTQISYVSSSPFLANRNQFQTYFQLLASESNLAYGYYGLVRKFKWRKIAIIGQNENVFTKVNDLLTQQLRANNVTYTEVLFPSSEGIVALEDRLFDPEARIFIISTYSSQAIEVLCKAYAEQKYYPRYQFILPGWYDDNWWIGSADEQKHLIDQYQCSVEHRERVLEYSFSIAQDEFMVNYSAFTDSGITGTTFYELYNELIAISPFGNESIIYAQQSYDATWTLARALNKTMTDLAENKTLNQYLRHFNSNFNSSQMFGLQHFTYNNTAMLNLMFHHLTRTDFIGLSGRVRFNEDGIKIIVNIIVNQYKRSAKTGSLQQIKVASNNISDPKNITVLFDEGVDIQYLWPHGMIPYDGFINTEQATVGISVTVVYSVLATAGLILAVICIIFNFVFRNRKLMKLSSPNLNYLIGTGAVVLYINMYLFIIPTKDTTAVSVLCNIYPWLASLGYSLCYGTVLMKMGRIFYIFNNAMSTSPKKTIHDWTLAIGVLALVTIDVAILIVFSVISRNKLVAVSIQNRENPEDIRGSDNLLGVVTRYYIYVCDSTARDITINVIYGIKALLQVVALIFAFSIRKVNIKGLDDSPFIIAAIYVSSVVLAVVFISSITLIDFVNIYAIVHCTGFFIGTTMVLLLVFVPKMVGLYKDPHGINIFKNPHTELTEPASTVKKEIGGACQLQRISHEEKCQNGNGIHAPMKRSQSTST